MKKRFIVCLIVLLAVCVTAFAASKITAVKTVVTGEDGIEYTHTRYLDENGKQLPLGSVSGTIYFTKKGE